MWTIHLIIFCAYLTLVFYTVDSEFSSENLIFFGLSKRLRRDGIFQRNIFDENRTHFIT